MINVHAVKFLAKPAAREPQNIGIIVSRDGAAPVELKARFVGEREDGTVQGRALRVPTDVYQRWASYFLRKVKNGEWDDIARLNRSRPANFYLDHLTTVPDERALAEVLDRAFSEYVSIRSGGTEARDELKDRVEAVLQTAGVTAERDLTVDGQLRQEMVPVTFSYAYRNGQLHLMDRVQTQGAALSVRKNAFDFAMRAEMATKAGAAQSFVAFVDLEGGTESIETDLRVLEQLANVVDVADMDAAVRSVQELMGH